MSPAPFRLSRAAALTHSRVPGRLACDACGAHAVAGQLAHRALRCTVCGGHELSAVAAGPGAL